MKAERKRIKRTEKSVRAKSEARQIEKKVFFESGEEAGAKAPDTPKRRARRRRSKLAAFEARLGKTRILVRGEGALRAVSALMKVCAVTDLAVSEDGASFFVESKLLNKIVALLDNLCYDYKIIGRYGVAPALLRALARAGLALGAVIFALMMFVYPCFITRVSVACVTGESLDGALNARVRQILSSHGVDEGKWAPSVDADAISRELLALDGVSYAGVERKGTHVNVLLKRELPADGLWGIEGSVVKATRLATVTRVVVEGGTALVKYGDVVRPDDPLIDGYVMLGEDKIPVPAKGRVYGTVLLRSDVFFADIALEKRYGAVKRKTALGFFGKTPKQPQSPFECYELRTTRSKLGFLLPIECFTYEFRELTVVEREEVRSDDELVAAVYSKLLAELEEEAGIKGVYHSVSRESGGRVVSVTVEAEVLISG